VQSDTAGPTCAPRGVLIREGSSVRLTDLDTASYLFCKNLPLVDAVKVTRYKYEITFHDPDGRAEALAIEFINSCCADFADAVCRIKKVIHRFHGRDEAQAQKGNGSRGRSGYPVDRR
jgi:hypothetical protein